VPTAARPVIVVGAGVSGLACAGALAAAGALLDTARSHACLALIAAYPADVPPPPWDAAFPEGSRILQAALHESSKRAPAPFLALVLQGHAGWSRAHEEDAGWPEALLAEAGRVLGAWAARPRLVQPHRWRWARVDRVSELAAPLLLALPGGGRVGVCGDRFAPGGGVEAAWRSGRALAARVLEEGA
jgi:renalase